MNPPRSQHKASAAIAVTGASGFLGRHLIDEIAARGLVPIAVGRRAQTIDGVEMIDAGENFSSLKPEMLEGARALIHCAARVHQVNEASMDDDALRALYLAANVDGALQAARIAHEAGVKRFVFVSTMHVHAKVTESHVVLRADSPCQPQSHYAKSKLKAERVLERFCRTEGMELVIVRPPLVYGAGVKAKFAQLVRWVAGGRPLPFGALTENRRSFVSADNLADFLLLCAFHEKAAGRAWLVADGDPVSTAELIAAVAQASGVKLRNWPVPVGLLRMGLKLIGRAGVLDVLDGSLAADITDNRTILGWQPKETMHDALLKFCALGLQYE